MEYKILLVLFLCHFLADYTHLSTSWMLMAKRFGKPLFPILIHALIHSILMGVCLYVCFDVSLPKVFYLFAIQLFSHFVIDVTKGRMNEWLPSLQSPTNKWHWIVFGADQYLHAVVIIFMAFNSL